MNCDWHDIGCKIDKWFIEKWDIITLAFWNWMDFMALVGLVSCIFLAMFGLDKPKKIAIWIIALYLLAKFFQIAGEYV